MGPADWRSAKLKKTYTGINILLKIFSLTLHKAFKTAEKQSFMYMEEVSIPELQRRIALYDDEAAYKALFYRVYTPLVNFACSFVQQREVAEEIVSDVLITVWEKRSDLEKIEQLKVYLYVSVRNNVFKYLVRNKKMTSVQLEDINVSVVDNMNHPEEMLVSKEMSARLQIAIQQLPPKCKMIYQMIKEDGLRYKEIAAILNISVKTIDNQLSIAIQKIGKSLKLNLKRDKSKKS